MRKPDLRPDPSHKSEGRLTNQEGLVWLGFTHGDLKPHNILVDDKGHLSGFLDWEVIGVKISTPQALCHSQVICVEVTIDVYVT